MLKLVIYNARHLDMELLDLVDDNDVVIGVTDKATAHANRQIHRVAAVFVFSRTGELYVQIHKKSSGRYDHSVGGHVLKGESYDEAARREAIEELGILQPLTKLTIVYSGGGSFLHMVGLFECVALDDWVFVPNDEVEEIIPMKLKNIKIMMKKSPEKFSSDFIDTMHAYCNLRGL